MPIKLMELEASVSADIRDYEKKLAKTEQDATKTVGRINRTFQSVRADIRSTFSLGGGSGGGMFGGGGGASDFLAKGGLITNTLKEIAGAMTGVQQAGLQYHRTVENAALGFEILTGSADKARKHLQFLEDSAPKLPFELTDIIRASGQLQAFGFDAEFAQKHLAGIGDAASAAAAFTGSFQDGLMGVTLALGQMNSAGKLSLEEINQLTGRAVPALDILARKLGVTKERLRKEISLGKIDGKKSAELLIEGFQEAYGGLSARLAKTTSGRESNLADSLAKSAYGTVKDRTVGSYNRLLDQSIVEMDSPDAQAMAKRLDTLGGSVIDGLVNTLKGGGTQAALYDGAMGAGKAIWDGFLKSDVTNLGTMMKNEANKMIGEFKTMWGIQSPSTVAAEMGFNVAAGYAIGLMSGKGLIDTALDQTLNAGKKRQRVLPLPDRAEVNLRKLTEKEPGFIPELRKIAERLQTRPEWLLQLMSLETAGSFNPAIRGGAGNKYTGLIQFGPGARKDVGLPEDEAAAVEFLKKLGATGQLPYVQKYLQQHSDGKPYDSLAKLYAAVGAGHFVSDDETVMFRKEGYQKGDDAANKKISSAGFRANAPWNVNKDSVIQQWEFGTAAAGALRLSDALESLGQTVTRINQAMSPQLSMMERYALHNPGVAFAPQLPTKRGGSPGKGATTVYDPIGASIDVVAEFFPKVVDFSKAIGDVARKSSPEIGPATRAMLVLNPALTGLGDASESAAPKIAAALDKVTQTAKLADVFFKEDRMQNLKDGYTGLFADLQNDLLSSQESFSNIMRGFFRNFITSTLSEVEQAMVEKMTGQKGGLAGMLGATIGSVIGGFFGFGGGVPKRAAGGSALANKLHIWNEPGAEGELFVPSQNGYILNRKDAMAAVSSAMTQRGGGTTYVINNTFHVTSPNGAITKESQAQMAAKMAQVLRQADARG
jgi:tape measure domain-containing protein